MLKDRIGNAQVTFRVFKINWVHLMRHGRRPDLIFCNHLLEIVHGYISPHIPVHVDKDGVDPFQVVEECRQVIVMLYLCGSLKPF